MENNKRPEIYLIKKYLRDGRAPVPEKENTSKVMSANKAKNTKPEIILRSAMWKENLRGFRLHLKNIPGRPDIAFPSKKLAVFVNGCFWHRCPHCNLSLPKQNQDFWKDKFQRNTERDKKKIDELAKEGWNSFVIWECEIKANVLKIVEKLKKKLY